MRTDGELLTAIADGDRGALRELHDGNVVWITARLRRRCADGDAVAEAVQDTFVAVWKGAARWDGRGEPAAWIWGIAIRRLIGVLRSRSRWSRAREAVEATVGPLIFLLPPFAVFRAQTPPLRQALIA